MYVDTFTISAIVVGILILAVTVVTIRGSHAETANEVRRLKTQLDMIEQQTVLPSHASRELCCAIRHLYPHALHGIDYKLADDGSGPYIAEWLLEHPRPEAKTLDEAMARYREMVAESNYRELRRSTYPGVGDQLDALYQARHGDLRQLEMLDQQIARVKERYPKPEMCRQDCDPPPVHKPG